MSKTILSSLYTLTVARARKAGGSLEEQLNEANQMIVHYVKAKDSAVKSREEAILNYKRKKAECENVSETLKEALAEQDRLRQDNEELKANETTLRRDLDDAKQRARDCVSLVETVVKDKAQLKTDSSNLADEKARVEHQLAENEAKLAQAQATLRRWAKNVGKLQEKVEEDQRSLDLNTSTSIKSENASTASPDESQTNVPRARASTPDQKPNIPDPASANKRSTYRYDLSIDGSPDSKSKSFWPNRCRVCDKSFRTPRRCHVPYPTARP